MNSSPTCFRLRRTTRNGDALDERSSDVASRLVRLIGDFSDRVTGSRIAEDGNMEIFIYTRRSPVIASRPPRHTGVPFIAFPSSRTGRARES